MSSAESFTQSSKCLSCVDLDKAFLQPKSTEFPYFSTKMYTTTSL